MDKILFFDIDGTLGQHGVITESNLKALHLLKEKGYKTFICTGRAPFYAKRLFGDLVSGCLLYTSDAADEEDSVDLGGRGIINKKKQKKRRKRK